ncbi:wax ester/triacylglycerol synthase family O-acyltransferase [Thalassotalea psychrophila]|uniref:diacylglycerol O-acyltransferase n=1 Tax=Thalassotalea psychrophila TaxID=3065647 RepID=A0ABY9TNN9_9GAMM|nr:wax ester/triacylglycerol synthase family O-acyltransferase [Colwelliaceae bacterium SQ149]
MALVNFSDLPLLNLGSENNRVDTFVTIYDQKDLTAGPVRFKQILNRISARLRLYPKYHQVQSNSLIPFGSKDWLVDDTFDPEFHIRHVALPQPGDWRQFCILVARMHARPIDETRPLWEINVIEGLNDVPFPGSGHFALVCKIHHELMSASEKQGLIWAIHDALNEDDVRAEINRTVEPVSVLAPLNSLLKMNIDRMIRPLAEPISTSVELTRGLVSAILPNVKFFSNAVFCKNDVPYTRFNTDISSFRVWDSCSFNQDKFQSLKDKYPQFSTKDLLVTIIGGALKLYLQDKKELTNHSLKILMPRIEKEQQSTDLHLSYYVHDLFTSTENTKARLESVAMFDTSAEENIESTPLSEHLSGFQKMSKANDVLHSIQTTKAASNPLANTALIDMGSNHESMCFFNAPMVYFSGVPQVTNGLGLIHMMSYTDDKVNLAFTSCREMLPDPSFYSECIDASFNELFDIFNSGL